MESVSLSSNFEKDIHKLAEDIRDDDALIIRDIHQSDQAESSPNWEKLVSQALGLDTKK